MSTVIDSSDIRAFYDFLGKRLDDPPISPEASVEEFRAYQEELQRARNEIAESHAEYVAGKARPLDPAAVLDRLNARLAVGRKAE